MQAQKSLSSISANRDLWIAQYRQELADRDKRSSISAALKKGRMEGKYEVARNFLKMGLSFFVHMCYYKENQIGI